MQPTTQFIHDNLQQFEQCAHDSTLTSETNRIENQIVATQQKTNTSDEYIPNFNDDQMKQLDEQLRNVGV